MGLDLITMAATISKLKNSGQIGSGEPGKTYAWDGILEGKDYVPYMEGAGFVKVSSDTPDLRKFEKIDTVNGTFMADGDEHYFADGTAENNELFGAKGCALMQRGSSAPFAVVITDTLNSPIPSTGLYFFCMDFGTGTVEAMTYELVIAGTVKTIDPKYLPSGGGGGGELPVIDLVALGMDFTDFDPYVNSQASTYGLSADMQAELISKLTALKPVIVKFEALEVQWKAILNPANFTDDTGGLYSASTVSCVSSEPVVYSLYLDGEILQFMSTPISY